jgi:hypothetical protein
MKLTTDVPRIATIVAEVKPVQSVSTHIGEPAESRPILPPKAQPAWHGGLELLPNREVMAQRDHEQVFVEQVY